MITIDMIGKVRRMKLRDQLSFSEIAKRTGLYRTTIKQWFKPPSNAASNYELTGIEGQFSASELTS